jgi:hypothetical protein
MQTLHRERLKMKLKSLQEQANQYRAMLIIEAKREKHSLAFQLNRALLKETREKIRAELKSVSQRNVVKLHNA